MLSKSSKSIHSVSPDGGGSAPPSFTLLLTEREEKI